MHDGGDRGHDAGEDLRSCPNTESVTGKPPLPHRTSGIGERKDAPEPEGTHPGGPRIRANPPDEEIGGPTETSPCGSGRQPQNG